MLYFDGKSAYNFDHPPKKYTPIGNGDFLFSISRTTFVLTARIASVTPVFTSSAPYIILATSVFCAKIKDFIQIFFLLSRMTYKEKFVYI